jgi:hypothetical protein
MGSEYGYKNIKANKKKINKDHGFRQPQLPLLRNSVNKKTRSRFRQQILCQKNFGVGFSNCQYWKKKRFRFRNRCRFQQLPPCWKKKSESGSESDSAIATLLTKRKIGIIIGFSNCHLADKKKNQNWVSATANLVKKNSESNKWLTVNEKKFPCLKPPKNIWINQQPNQPLGLGLECF